MSTTSFHVSLQSFKCLKSFLYSIPQEGLIGTTFPEFLLIRKLVSFLPGKSVLLEHRLLS